MSEKNLSTSTLSLRFMQNAYRAKQLAQVEAEQARVKDEAEWEVSKEVKEAWGVGTRSNETEETISCESSYMPFLFDRDVSDDVAKPRGRRIYNKGGHELLNDAKEATYQPQADAGLVHPLGKGPARSGSISAHLPVGFASIGHSTAVQKLPKDPNKIKNAPESTMQVIRDGANIDLVHAVSTKQSLTQINSLGTAFLKPSGVDEPTSSSGAQGSTVIPTNNDIVVKARCQVKVTKRKREQEVVSVHNDKEKKKRKKKKTLVE